jgi:hypothetical protein
LGGRGRRISEFKASLVYKVNSRTAWPTQKNPDSKKKKKNKKKRDFDLTSLVFHLQDFIDWRQLLG